MKDNPAGDFALIIGSELDQLNLARAHLGRRHVDPTTPGGARFLMSLALIDRRRRNYRQSLKTLHLASEYEAI